MNGDVRVFSDIHFNENKGNDLIDLQNFPTSRLRSSISLKTIKETVAQNMNLSTKKIRLWNFLKRKNNSFRPNKPYNDMELKKEISSFKTQYKALNIYIEIFENGIFEDDVRLKVLLFLKYYNPKMELGLEYIGKIYASRKDKIEELFPIFRSMKNISQDTPLIAWEEISIQRIDPIDTKLDIKECQFQSGDIIIFQEKIDEKDILSYRYPTPKEFFMHLEESKRNERNK